MRTRRLFMDLLLVLAFAALGFFCYSNGKAYNFILDNTAYSAEQLEAMEAVSVSVDGGAPKVLYADDKDIAVAVGGGEHVMRIDTLDLQDRPIDGEGREYSFSLQGMGKRPSINVPFAYKNGRPVK